MNIYTKKQQWKFILFSIAIVLSLLSLFFLTQLIDRVEKEERKSVMLWADAIQKKSTLVEYTKELFEKLKVDEREKVELWSDAMHRLLNSDNSSDLTILVKIISSNKNIPIILSNSKDEVISTINLSCELKQGTVIPDSIKKMFSKHKPIEFFYKGKLLNKLYYKDSKLFAELQNVMNNLVESFISEVVANTASVPVIITNNGKNKVIASGNVEDEILSSKELLKSKLEEMESSNQPIQIMLSPGVVNYVFFEDSYFLKVLKYYPIVLFFTLIVFLVIAYFAFTASRRYEQNQVWMGMSKETAHQLGTPISSLMAWVDILRMKDVDPEIVAEIEKDTFRLQIIAERFSKIGSKSVNTEDNVVEIIEGIVDYIRVRTSSKIKINVNYEQSITIVPINKSLFEWVIENLCKNAIDSIGGQGVITIDIINKPRTIVIDVSDTGKGIPRSKFKTVFKPGYTTKKRGWGLGLTLVKRIVEDYHKGRIFVKSSELDKGTTFRIILLKIS